MNKHFKQPQHLRKAYSPSILINLQIEHKIWHLPLEDPSKMKFISAATLAFCLASETLAEAVAWNDNSPRSIGDRTLDKRTTVSTLPLENPLCNGYSVSVANISSAVQQGVSLNNNNQQIGELSAA